MGLGLILGREAWFEVLGGGDRRKDRRTDTHPETGENCPMWNHRSSAPPGPLPKKDIKKERVVVDERKKRE